MATLMTVGFHSLLTITIKRKRVMLTIGNDTKGRKQEARNEQGAREGYEENGIDPVSNWADQMECLS